MAATLSWGSTGDEVAKLQQILTDLGHYSGPLDGRFGPLTRAAVMAFQRSAGLTADGIVGAQTWAALANVPQGGSPGPSTGEPQEQPGGNAGAIQAIAVHIGVNRVDPARYGGWDGKLTGCENDARTMAAIATSEGFQTRQLFSPNTTVANVLAAIRDAATRLPAGGIFLLTYAGHGGQVDDVSGDDEDRKDETWVLFDRQLLDDEINLALGEFRAGVQVVTVSDSCHSGTVTRGLRDPLQEDVAELKRAFYTNLAVPRAGFDDPGVNAFPRPVQAAQEVAGRSTPAGSGPTRYPGQYGGRTAVLEAPAEVATDVVTREMPLGINLLANEIQADELAEARDRASGARGMVVANCVHYSGCRDNQLSQETGGNGVFTTALKRTWANGSFTGTYRAFHAEIVAQMGPTQTPEIRLFGGDPESLAGGTPFNI